MRTRPLVLIATALLFLATLSFPPPRARAAGRPLVLVIAARAALRDISTATLRRVFQGMPTDFEGGRRFVPLNHPTGTPTRVQFDRALLGLEPEAIGAFWVDRRIRDESPPPRTIPSTELALRIVASLPGAITYVYPEAVTAAVKVLTIDGKSAAEPGYLLK